MRNHAICWLSLWLVLGWISEPMANGSQRVSFDLYDGYLIVIQGSAGRLKDLHFLIDTGASPSVLDQQLAQRLHLEQRPANVATLNGSAPGGWTVVPSLQIGPVRKENLRVATEDLYFIQKFLPVHLDGIIGLDVLGQAPFLIDYTSREIQFGPLPPRVTSLPVSIQAGLPIVEAEFDHTSVHVMLDTGSPSLVLFRAGTTPTVSPIDTQQSAKTIGNVDRSVARLERIRLGQEAFGKEPVFLAPGRHDMFRDDFDGLVSPAALGIREIGFDLARGVLGFSH